jgi:hypothetical protein
MRILPILLSGLLALAFDPSASGHSGDRPSVHDTVAGVIERLTRERDAGQLRSLSRGRAERVLTEEERGFWPRGTFPSASINRCGSRCFTTRPWAAIPSGSAPRLAPQPAGVKARKSSLIAGRKPPAGHVGLGVTPLGRGRHYLPCRGGRGWFARRERPLPRPIAADGLPAGAAPWADWEEILESAPPEFAGQILVQTPPFPPRRREVGGRVQWSRHPATDRPDHVVLTWSGIRGQPRPSSGARPGAGCWGGGLHRGRPGGIALERGSGSKPRPRR